VLNLYLAFSIFAGGVFWLFPFWIALLLNLALLSGLMFWAYQLEEITQ
jgi:hypothetical protein